MSQPIWAWVAVSEQTLTLKSLASFISYSFSFSYCHSQTGIPPLFPGSQSSFLCTRAGLTVVWVLVTSHLGHCSLLDDVLSSNTSHKMPPSCLFKPLLCLHHSSYISNTCSKSHPWCGHPVPLWSAQASFSIFALGVSPTWIFAAPITLLYLLSPS